LPHLNTPDHTETKALTAAEPARAAVDTANAIKRITDPDGGQPCFILGTVAP
jgi:hypothetical protein